MNDPGNGQNFNMTDIIVRAKPSASRNSVEKITAFEYVVWTTEPPVHGRANRAILKLLADHISVSILRLANISRERSKVKTISLL